jgi:hypothetical protein
MVNKVEGRSDDLALLTRKERDWLLGKIEASKAMQRDLRYRIRKKIEILQNQEIPLLVDNGFFESNKDNKQGQSNQYIGTINAYSVVTNDDGIASNPDVGRWSSLVKISPQTSQKSKENDAVNRKQHKNKWQDSEMGRVGCRTNLT